MHLCLDVWYVLLVPVGVLYICGTRTYYVLGRTYNWRQIPNVRQVRAQWLAWAVHALASTPFILLVQRIQDGWKAVPLR